LNPDDRKKAIALWQALQLAERRLLAGEKDVLSVRAAMREHLQTVAGLGVDYATVCDAQTLEELSTPRAEMVALIAARVGSTRLIDNLPIQIRSAQPL
jgi:pantoate--beta-alanine ligase